MKLVLGLLCSLFFLQGWSQTSEECLKIHQQWMKEHMPSPASLSDEELVRQASDAVYSLAYEPENIALIRAAGKFDPSLADYAAFKELRTPDTGYNRKNAALKCLADVARNRFGEEAFVTVHCLFNQVQNLLDTNQEASFLLIKKCCVLQEKITAHSPTNRNKEALYLYQLYSMYLSNLLTGDNPLFFKELFRIEKEVLAFYEGWKENTLSKADIYSIIGCLKNATLYTAISNDLFWAMFPNGNKMEAYNENNDYVSNAFSYLAEALDIRRQLLNPHHPDLSYDKSNLYYFLIQRSHLLTETENTKEEITQFYNYCKLYFPAESPHFISCRMLLWESKAAFGEGISETAFYQSMKRAQKNMYGELGQNYLHFLCQLCFLRARTDTNDAFRLAEEYNSLVEKKYANDPILQAEWLYYLLSFYLSLPDNTLFTELTKKTSDLYKAHHAPNWRSITLGKQMANDYNNYFMNFTLACDIQETVLQDIEKLIGTHVPVYSYEYFMLGTYIQSFDMSKALQVFPRIIQNYEENRMNPIQPLLWYAESLNTLPDKKKECEKAYLKALDACDKQDTLSYSYLLLNLGNLYLYSQQRDEKKIHATFKKAIPLYLSQKEKTDAETIRGFLMVADYYHYTRQLELEEKYLIEGKERYETDYAVYDNNYLLFINTLFNFYLFDLNQTDQAELLLESHIEDIQRNSMLAVTSQYLDFLWNRYLLATIKTPNDLIRLFQNLFAMIEPTQKLYVQSNENQTIMYTYLTRIFCEIFNYCKYLDKVEDTEIQHYTPAQLQEWEQGKVNIKQGKEILLTLKDGFPTYDPNYRRNNYYYNILDALSNYYEYVEHDYTTALHYYQEKYSSVLANGEKERISAAHRDFGYFYFRQGKFEKACTELEQYEKDLEKNQTTDAYAILNTTSCLANCYLALHKWEQALEPSRKYYQAVKRLIDLNFDYMTESERIFFLETYTDGGMLLQYLLSKLPQQLSGDVYNTSLHGKGLLLRSWERIRKSIYQSGNTELIAAVDSVATLQRQLKLISAENKNYTEFSQEVWNIREKIERLEKQIARESTPYRPKNQKEVVWTDIKGKLKKGEAAIEFVMSDSLTTALIITAECEQPLYVPLTDGNHLFNQLQTYMDYPTDKRADLLYNKKQIDLYSLLWKPLEAHLSNISTIYYSPSGYLNLLSFPAFQMEDGRYLMDKYKLYQLTTTAEIVYERTETAPTSGILFGGIYYSPEQEEEAQSGKRGRGAMDVAFGYLANTSNETDHISQLMHEKQLKQVKLYKGAQATEQNFNQLNGNSPSIIHLATHGFFIEKEEDIKENRFLQRFPNANYVSMQRAGLAFVGANAAWEGNEAPENEDGILTANELSLINLENTDLVVLSACETALGLYSQEGVFGLQRGFKQAGVHSLIVSLWSVDDLSTSTLMQKFYELWLNGMNKHDAFEQAIKEVRKVYKNPYYWAPFVLLDAI